MIDEWGSYAFSCVTPITVWVVSKNESNCLSENKMISILIRRHVSLLYIVQSNILWPLLFCYLTITDVTLYLQIIDFQFPSCCTSQPPKKLNQIITVNSSTNTPITKKISFARVACLCSHKVLDSLCLTVNNELVKLTDWFFANKLSINIKKIKLFYF